jgi:superfamily II DNA or RNA helicase
VGASANSAFTLRKWQEIALAEWKRHGQSGIVEVVTGGGKTRFALAAMLEWMPTVDHDFRVLIIVPTSALQDQWYLNLTSDLGISKDDISIWPDQRDTARTFHIMVINTARNSAERIAHLGRPTLLIADECHRYASEQNARALEIRKDVALGLTATAEREYDDGLERVLVPSLGPIIYKYTLAEARTDGVVSDFRLTNVQVPFTGEEEFEYEKLSRSLRIAIAKGEDERAKRIALRRASVSKRAVARITATIALAERLRGKKMLVFHEDIKIANLLTNLLYERKHRVVTYHSKIGPDMRRDNLRMFRTGLADVLVCCRALDEGIDVPEAECAILSASTSSHRQRVQRLGRVLRLSKDKELAHIYTVYVSESERDKLIKETSRLEGVAETSWMEMSR